MLDWSLVDGAVPLMLSVLGVLCGLILVVRRQRTWWIRVVPLVAVGAVVCCLLVWLVLEQIWRPFPDRLPWRVLAWIGVAAAGLALGAVGWRRARWRRRIAVTLAALLVLLTAAMKVNAYYGQYPTLRAALGLPSPGEVAFGSVPAFVDHPRPSVTGHALAYSWRPSTALPARGVVAQVDISPTWSGFAVSRRAYVYLPPAYLAPDRPLLPVLVLLHGQPGAPADWINGGRLASTMDRFAAMHHGLAPVVVLPDATGGTFDNPLCLDSRLGNSETYLTRDVPEWIRRTLQVDPNPRHWAVAGSSYGGTCALQLALRRPDVYPVFVDISGQSEPSLGDRRRTVQAAFGGDEAEFRRVNPMDLLAAARFPRTVGMLTVGRTDAESARQQREVLAACRRAGVDVQLVEVPGAHNWYAWAGGLERSLAWLGDRLGITLP